MNAATESNDHTWPAGVILAGGKSSRFGCNKALALYNSRPIITRVAEVLSEIFTETLLVTNSPEEYTFLGWPMTGDRVRDSGPLAGIQAALSHIRSERAFIVACDMPQLDGEIIRRLCRHPGEWDVILPLSASGHEPLHAVYRRDILPKVDHALAQGEKRIGKLLEQLRVEALSPALLGLNDPDEARRIFTNINYQQDLRKLP